MGLRPVRASSSPSYETVVRDVIPLLVGICHLLVHVHGNDENNEGIEDRCEPCPGDSFQVLVTSSDDESGCQDVLSETLRLQAGTADCTNAQLRNFQRKCCEKPPRGICSLCPDGSSYDPDAMVPSFDPRKGELSCTDLNVDPSFLDFLFEDGTCSDTLLQRSAAWCGCPDVERSCYLCPDGSRPPNPTLVDPVYYGWNCASFDFVSSYFSEDECKNLVEDVFEFDAPSWCGCPNVPVPSVCRLCPVGQQIVQPHEVLARGFTCQELALSTRYIGSQSPCDRVLTSYQSKGYIDTCCGPISSSAASLTGRGMGIRPNGIIFFATSWAGSVLSLTTTLMMAHLWYH